MPTALGETNVYVGDAKDLHFVHHRLEPRRAARQGDADVVDVGGELRRRHFERRADAVHDAADRFAHRLADLGGADRDDRRQAVHEVAAADFHLAAVCGGVHGADRLFEHFGGALTDENAVFPADVGDDRLVELVARDTDGACENDAAEGQNGHLGGAAADVDDHGAAGVSDAEPRADRRCDGLFDQHDLLGAGVKRHVFHGALFHLGDAAGDAHDDARAADDRAADRLPEEMAEHFGGHAVFGDNAVFQRAHGDDRAGRLAQHELRFVADGLDDFRAGVHGDHGRLAQDDALAAAVNDRVGGAEVDSDVLHSVFLLLVWIVWGRLLQTSKPNVSRRISAVRQSGSPTTLK